MQRNEDEKERIIGMEIDERMGKREQGKRICGEMKMKGREGWAGTVMRE